MNMAIKIQTQKPSIPVEIGNLKFEFDVSDESVKQFREKGLVILREFENLEVDENDEEKSLDNAKDVVKRGYEFILGEGSFEKVYELSPSILILMKYYEQIVTGIREELKKMGLNPDVQEKARKYLANKKK